MTATIGYCMSCKEKKPMKNEQNTTTKNGKSAVKGQCSSCGTNMYVIKGNSPGLSKKSSSKKTISKKKVSKNSSSKKSSSKKTISKKKVSKKKVKVSKKKASKK